MDVHRDHKSLEDGGTPKRTLQSAFTLRHVPVTILARLQKHRSRGQKTILDENIVRLKFELMANGERLFLLESVFIGSPSLSKPIGYVSVDQSRDSAAENQ